MSNLKVDFILMAFMVLLHLANANPPNCPSCIGDKLIDTLTQFDTDAHCLYVRHKDFLSNVKVFTTRTLAANLREALLKSNDLTEEACRANVPLDTCHNQTTNDVMLECYMDSAKKLAHAIREQEMCHGKAFKIEEMRIAHTFIKGTSAAFKVFHPDC